MKDSLSVINQYLNELGHDKAVKCSISNSKGRFLIAQKAFRAGQVLFSSEPLCVISEPPPDSNILYSQIQSWVLAESWECEAIWYWCCVTMILTEQDVEQLINLLKRARRVVRKSSRHRSNRMRDIAQNVLNLPLVHITEETRMRLMLFHAPFGDDENVSYSINCLSRNLRKEIKFEGVGNRDSKDDNEDDLGSWLKEDLILLDSLSDLLDIRKIEKYSRIWILNCFDCTEDQQTSFGTYFTSTFINHSCLPNTVWHVDANGHFHLMARNNIEQGDEITLAYISDMDLLSPSIIRIQELDSTKHFICICPRCTASADTCRGIKCQNCLSGQWFMPSKTNFVESTDPQLAEDALNTIAVNDNMLFKLRVSPDPLSTNFRSIQALSFSHQAQVNWLADVQPQKCLSCGHVPTEEELKVALSVEKYMYETHRNIESMEDHELESLVLKYSKFCGQHYYYTE